MFPYRGEHGGEATEDRTSNRSILTTSYMISDQGDHPAVLLRGV